MIKFQNRLSVIYALVIQLLYFVEVMHAFPCLNEMKSLYRCSTKHSMNEYIIFDAVKSENIVQWKWNDFIVRIDEDLDINRQMKKDYVGLNEDICFRVRLHFQIGFC